MYCGLVLCLGEEWDGWLIVVASCWSVTYVCWECVVGNGPERYARS